MSISTEQTTATTNKEGILSQWVQQAISDNLTITSNGYSYKENWKGSYSEGLKILGNVRSGSTLTTFHTFLGSDRLSIFNAPQLPMENGINGIWKIEDITIDELDAGEHCIIKVSCIGVYDNTTAGGGETEQEEITTKSTWSVSWQSYSVSPFEFCSNRQTPVKYYQPGGEQQDSTFSFIANRTNIEEYKVKNPQTVGELYMYTPDLKAPNKKKLLSYSEIAVLKKLNLGRSATYHYPIITHTTVNYKYGVNGTFNQVLGVDLDVISTTVPAGCPYKFAYQITGNGSKAYEWIKIADDISQEKDDVKDTVVFTRRESWMGTLDADVNFYGSRVYTASKGGVDTGRWYKNCM